MTKLQVLITVTLFSFTSMALAAGENLVGRYQYVSGEMDQFHVACPQQLTVHIQSGDVLVTSDQSEFDNNFSVEKIDQGKYGCVNKGNPLANACYRSKGDANRVYTEYGDAFPWKFKVRLTRALTRSGDTLTADYNYSGADSACLYKRY